MEEYISREALLESFGEEPHVWMDTPEEIQKNSDWHNYRELVENAPAANVAPVVEAEWVSHDFDIVFGCSACGYLTDFALSHFCPNCGARMRKETT